MAQPALLILLGLLAGILSGLVGVGGGILIVPALVLLFHFTQQQAQGTSLAVLLLPVGIFAVWTYYTRGFIDIKVAAYICAGFVFGGWLGAKFATNLSNATLQKAFGVFLLLVAIKMIWGK
jgi:uncharacterized protein